jgi:hypothetical protein
MGTMGDSGIKRAIVPSRHVVARRARPRPEARTMEIDTRSMARLIERSHAPEPAAPAPRDPPSPPSRFAHTLRRAADAPEAQPAARDPIAARATTARMPAPRRRGRPSAWWIGAAVALAVSVLAVLGAARA